MASGFPSRGGLSSCGAALLSLSAKPTGKERAMAATRLSSSEAYQRMRLPTPTERDRLADYLRLGGWDVEARGRRDLRARWRHARGEGSERVSFRFSVAVWRAMHP